MIEHKYWKRESEEGIGARKQHIAIIGYSHYRKAYEKDHADFTNKVMKNVLSGEQRGDSFFSSIPTYFGSLNRAEFWRRVHFFNFVPSAFVDKEMFALASEDQVKIAKKRVLQILGELAPKKVFVFSRKAWSAFPNTVEEEDGKCIPLICSPKDNWGTYVINGKKIRVCGFRHPLFAKTEKMRFAVEEFLAMD